MNRMLLLGYAVSTMLLWGYALRLLLESRSIRERERKDSGA